MIRVFGPTDKSYTSNGDAVVQATKATVHKEDNGDFYIDFACGIQYKDYIVSNNVIVADTPQGAQAFRILNPTVTRSKITCKCWHVFYDSENYLIADSYVVDSNCNVALDHLNAATEPKSPFTTISDVPTVDSFRCVRKSLYEAIQTVIERWGGHLVRDNWAIGVRQRIGTDNGVTVRYGKNLKDIKAVYDWSKVVTKLLPVGKDGLLLNAKDSSASIYVTSDVQYPVPYTKTVSFSQDIDKDDYGSDDEYQAALLDDLLRQATDYINANNVPNVNYTMSANVEKVTDIGDTVEVIDDRLGLDMMTNIISYEWDCITQRYTKLEFGTFQPKLSNLVSGITSKAESAANAAIGSVSTTISDSISASEERINGVLSNSYVIYDGEQILVVDSLPKETAHNVLRINSAGIGFSQNGIGGSFTSAWAIDGTLNMQAMNVVNLVADLIKGGTLKLGGADNGNGVMEVRSAGGSVLGRLDKDGLRMWANDGSRIEVNASQGLVGYDAKGNATYGVTNGVFYMRNGYVQDSLAVGGLLKMVPINTDANEGIAFVALA